MLDSVSYPGACHALPNNMLCLGFRKASWPKLHSILCLALQHTVLYPEASLGVPERGQRYTSFIADTEGHSSASASDTVSAVKLVATAGGLMLGSRGMEVGPCGPDPAAREGVLAA